MTIINYNPKIWGPKEWFFLETMVRSLPESIDDNLQNNIKLHFSTLSKLLPCEICQEHFSQYIENTKMMNKDFSKKENVILWLNDCHNILLESNKRQISDVNRYYRDIYNSDTTTYLDLGMIIIFITILMMMLKYFKA